MTAMDALNRARLAYERSQPQTFLEFDGLNAGLGTPAGAGGSSATETSVEPRRVPTPTLTQDGRGSLHYDRKAT